MGSGKRVGDWRLFLGFLLAPAVAPVFLWFSLDGVLTWFRPQASNMAIGMFALLIIGVAVVVAYPVGVGLGYPFVRRRLDEGRLDVRALVTGALVLALGFSVAAGAIPLLAREYALAVALAVTAALAFLLSGMCFYVITCAGRARMTADLTD
jgi:hypothetical protein